MVDRRRVDGQGRAGRQARVLWPLPGGSGNYLRALKKFLDFAADEPLMDVFVAKVIHKYSNVTSEKAARSYTHVVVALGLLQIWEGRVVRTENGERYAETLDREIVRSALIERIAGVSDLLDEIGSQPDRIGFLVPRMQERGFNWKGASQVRYRLRWLEEVGLVKQEGRARAVYSLTTPTDKPSRRPRRSSTVRGVAL